MAAADQQPPLCPSAQPAMPGSVVFGVVGGTAQEPRLGYLVQPLPVTDELLAMAAPAPPATVFRFAAPCAGSGCVHFQDDRCRLVSRAVETLPLVTEVLPACRIRRECRWWRQEGADACRRCPLVVTETARPSEAMMAAGDPSAYAAGD